jgi:hypothetical protein
MSYYAVLGGVEIGIGALSGDLEFNRSRLSKHLWTRILGQTTVLALVINGFIPR